MPDIERQFAQAVEPLIELIQALQADVERLKAVPPPDPAPLVEAIGLLRAEVHALPSAPDLAPLAETVEGIKAEVARFAAHRLDTPAWAPGVYRQGATVQHFHGQYFEATVDTAAEPGDGIAWRRLGLHGFRYRGLHIDGMDYEIGDLVAKDGAMMLQTGLTLTWLSLRGRDGKRGLPGHAGAPGSPGAPGHPGTPGKPGANLVKLEAQAGVLYAIWDDGRRAPIALQAVEDAA